MMKIFLVILLAVPLNTAEVTQDYRIARLVEMLGAKPWALWQDILYYQELNWIKKDRLSAENKVLGSA